MADVFSKEFKRDLYQLITNTYLEFLEDISPVQTGNLKRSWNLTESEPMVYIITNDAEYSRYLDEGTGIYGPKHKKIVPKSKKALKFSVGGVTIFAKSVKGIRPLMMIQKAATSKALEKKFDDGLTKLFEDHLLLSTNFTR